MPPAAATHRPRRSRRRGARAVMVNPERGAPASADCPAQQRVLRSPALYLGEVVLPPDRAPGRRRLLSGRTLKNVTFPLLYALARRAPRWVALLPFRLVHGLARALYAWPRNPLRRAAQDLSVVAARQQGYEVAPRALYLAWLRNARDTVDGYLTLVRDGVETALTRVQADAADTARLKTLISTHSGAILAVGHNFGSVFSAARLGRELPVLIISKNSATAERTRMAVELFERMQVQVLMVRGGSPVALSRAMFRALREGLGLAATVENVERGAGRVEVAMFGTCVGVSPWAAAIAAKRRVPVVPVWFESVPGGVRVRFGEALICDDAAALVRHYMAWFEARILEDPASWAYLADKHWRRVLAAAARAPS